jgi:hypothetical protein
MAEQERLVRAIHRLATEQEFRQRLLIAPREVLLDELGVSGEVYQALVSLVPVLLAGGLFVLTGGQPPGGNDVESAVWGHWGK